MRLVNLNLHSSMVSYPLHFSCSKMLFSVVILSCLLVLSHGLWFYPEDDPGNPIFFSSPINNQYPPKSIPEGGYNQNRIKGYLTYWNNPYKVPQNVNGTILIWDVPLSTRIDHMIEAYIDTGIVALLMLTHSGSKYPGYFSWGGIIRRPDVQQSWPLFQLSDSANVTLYGWMHNQTNGAYVEIGMDSNPWDGTYGVALPVLGFIILIIGGFTLLWAAYKLTLLIVRDGIQFNVGQVILILCICGSGIRIGFAASDPFGSYNLNNHVAIQVSYAISFPFELGACLLISLYWHELIHRSGTKINHFLDKMKWPFFIITTIVFLYELAFGLLRAYDIKFSIIVIFDGVIYGIIIVGLLIFFTITRIRLQKEFDKINRGLSHSNHGKKLRLATHQIYGMSAIMVIWICLLIWVAVSGSNFYTPWAFGITWYLFYFTILCITLLHVYMIRAPEKHWTWILCGLIHPEYYSEDSSQGISHSNSIKSTSQTSPRYSHESDK